jgi:preprotein translocase subunit SecE
LAEGEEETMDERPAKVKTSPGEFMRQVQAEGRKIYWPSRQETVTTAIFVGIMMVILALFFLGIDSLFGAVVRWLLSLA